MIAEIFSCFCAYDTYRLTTNHVALPCEWAVRPHNNRIGALFQFHATFVLTTDTNGDAVLTYSPLSQ
jgi:hypothetical protein